MNKICTWTLLSAFILVFVGCGHKKDAAGELEKVANAIAQAEPAPTPAPPPSEPAPATETTPQITQPQAPAPAPAQEVKLALAAYKAGNLEDAVTRLQKLRATTTITPQQRVALQDSIASVMTEIYTLAAKGDTRAIAAVKQYEQMQTRPR